MFSSFPRNTLFIIIGLALLFITAYSFEGSTMSFLNKPEEEVVLCSPMEGIITFKGEPAAGAKMERLIKWKDDIGETDSIITDENGRFSFPIRKETAELSKLTQFVVAQEIRVKHNEIDYPIWAKAKRVKEEFGELDGIPINFRCELTDDLVRIDAGRGTLMTSCKWDSIKRKE